MKTIFILKPALLIFFASFCSACNSNTSESSDLPESLDVPQLIDIHVNLRRPLQAILNDSLLFIDTSHYKARVFPVLADVEEWDKEVRAFSLANKMDTLLMSSSHRLFTSYIRMLRPSLKELFHHYQDKTDSFEMRREVIFSRFMAEDRSAVDNFHRFMLAKGYEVKVLEPIKIKLENEK